LADPRCCDAVVRGADGDEGRIQCRP
jgi:hypothetical protein